MKRSVVWLTVIALLVTLVPLALSAQRGRWGRRWGVNPNVHYDGRFVVPRIRYQGYSRWDADYPAMERNLSTILNSITAIDTHTDGSNVHDFDDPDLLRFPVAYLTEPGYWYPTDSEARGLREYIDKGGFLIVDDFHFAREWVVFEAGLRRAFPDAVIVPLDVTHPVFNSFFAIETLEVPYPGRLGEQGLMGEFYGIYEDNDPDKRLTFVINYNMDIGDYMEWSGTNRYSVAPSNEAYKFAINYIIYGMTH